MMDTSTNFESHIRRKKLIIYKCEQCPKMVFHNGYGYYCCGINLPHEKDRKIPDPREIPDWCPLKGEKFTCLRCGNIDNVDHNASKNLESLGLAGVYSLRSLPNFEDRNKFLYFRQL